MSAGWPDRRCLRARVVLVGLAFALLGGLVGVAWPAGEVEERVRELGLVRRGGPEQVVVRDQAAALRLLLELPRSVTADEGSRSGPPLVVFWVLAVLLAGAWGGLRVVLDGNRRLVRRVEATLGSRAPPRVRHA